MAFGSFMAPSRSFGGLKFDTQPNPANQWAKYLSTLNNEQDINALGLGASESTANQDEAWNRYLASMAGSMSPNGLQALNNNKWRIQAGFNQARATSTDPLRFAQYLGGLNTTDTLNSWSPQQALRPVTFYRVRASLNN